jgi:hypothetical protein
LRLPAFEAYGVPVVRPGESDAEATRIMGEFLRDVLRENAASHNFRLFGPDETASNRLQAVFEATSRAWNAETIPGDDHLAQDGRVTEILSEHTCQGWLEGYLLTGRHGLFSCYEAFIHSMFNQHAKWLKTSRWRRGRLCKASDPGQARRAQAVHRQAWRRLARSAGLALATARVSAAAMCCRQRAGSIAKSRSLVSPRVRIRDRPQRSGNKA